MSTLAGMVRARRKELGLTLEEVAEVVGVTPGALSHVESGRRLPDPRNAMEIARALQLDPDVVLTALDEAHAERRADQAGWSRPSERRSAPAVRTTAAATPVFHAMSIDAMFAEPDDTEGDVASSPHVLYSSMREETAAEPASRVRSNVGSASPRDRARYAPDSAARLQAADELAEEALRAIRTLRGMLDDDDPNVAREARRLLRELDVRGMDE